MEEKMKVTAELTAQVQQRLRDVGYFYGDVDGNWSENLVSSLQHYCQAVMFLSVVVEQPTYVEDLPEELRGLFTVEGETIAARVAAPVLTTAPVVDTPPPKAVTPPPLPAEVSLDTTVDSQVDSKEEGTDGTPNKEQAPQTADGVPDGGTPNEK